MAERYVVQGGSRTGHCCFRATVVDTQDTIQIGAVGVMCECGREEDAHAIAKALNMREERETLVRDIPTTKADGIDLRERLVTFARGLAAEQWYSSPSYESTPEDRIREAVADCKASIGRALLEALGVQP